MVVLVCVAEMMESCLAWNPERGSPIEVEDIKKNLLDEFAQVGVCVCGEEEDAD